MTLRKIIAGICKDMGYDFDVLFSKAYVGSTRLNRGGDYYDEHVRAREKVWAAAIKYDLGGGNTPTKSAIARACGCDHTTIIDALQRYNKDNQC